MQKMIVKKATELLPITREKFFCQFDYYKELSMLVELISLEKEVSWIEVNKIATSCFNSKILANVLWSKLPCGAFYVDNNITINEVNYLGYYVSRTINSKGQKELAFMFICEDGFDYLFTMLPIEQEGTIEDIMNDRLKNITCQSDELINEKCIELLKHTINTILYLCSDNKEIEYRVGRTSQEKYNIKKQSNKGTIKQEELGYRIGSTIRSNKVVYINDGGNDKKC